MKKRSILNKKLSKLLKCRILHSIGIIKYQHPIKLWYSPQTLAYFCISLSIYPGFLRTLTQTQFDHEKKSDA